MPKFLPQNLKPYNISPAYDPARAKAGYQVVSSHFRPPFVKNAGTPFQ